MKVKHTPGPWKIEPELFKYYFQITSDTGKKVASCHAGSNKHTDDQSDELCANARLIAAAPDLLEALQLLIAAERIGVKDGAKACAAIKKATGSDPWFTKPNGA